jgi:hypothetical protein
MDSNEKALGHGLRSPCGGWKSNLAKCRNFKQAQLTQESTCTNVFSGNDVQKWLYRNIQRYSAQCYL